jgi:hypothetical protein
MNFLRTYISYSYKEKEKFNFGNQGLLTLKFLLMNGSVCFWIMINKVVVDLQAVCKCRKMTAGPDWQFLCASHPNPNCTIMDYAYHTINTIQCLITILVFILHENTFQIKNFLLILILVKESTEFLLILPTVTKTTI